MSASQHIEWVNLVEKTGPFLAVGVLDEAFPQGLEKVETRKRQRVRSAYDEWRDAVDEADPQLDALHREWVRLVLEELLEYEPSVLKSGEAIPATLTYREPLSGAEVKPDFAVLSGDKARLLITRYAPDTDLSAPIAGETWAASPIERMTNLCRATGVRVGLVTDGEQWTLVSVPAEGSSSLGTWYARIWQQETVTLQAFVSLLEVRRCFGPAESNLDSLFLRSLEHQNEVTDTLGEQVRRAVEVLVQAFDRADLDRDRQLLKDVTPAQLYEAGLTVMMRLVVLLCAEERKLLLRGEPIYDQHYAVSTLRARLREDKERLGDEVLERRHDAWSRLLAVFRAVFGGIEHETLRLPALGGSLFDPDRFPFLEGRATGTSWRDTPSFPLPIDNRTVLILLTALQVLEQRTGALLLSYEALDVEQIGHVYEGLLERTVKRVPETTLGLIGSQKAVNPNIPLSELEEAKANGDGKLLAYLLEKTGRSESGLKSALAKQVDEPLYHRVLLACGSDIPLADRIKPFSLLLRTDSWGDPLAYRENSFIVTLGAGRRETGTHYTPKMLTEPIVQHTLEPLVYIGPAEGKPQTEWLLKSPREILALKVCDMAMGSAAFLVQTCRWLGDRLVEAWDAAEKAGRAVSVEGEVLEQAGNTELLPRDQAERVLIARRLIASRCLYGVDKNPMAVELAKVSLWLITMMKGRPFSFLDHALKCGDSVVGISQHKQLENFSIRDPDHAEPLLETANLWRHVEQAAKLRRELENLPSHTAGQIAEKSRLNVEAETQLAKLRAACDFLVAAELEWPTTQGWETRRAVAASQMQVAWKQELTEFQRLAKLALKGQRPFHWPLEFPEVFANGGFDALCGNPPYRGGRKIRETLGGAYLDYLTHCLVPGASANADLCAFFVRRANQLTRDNGTSGFIATSSMAEGDTREACLQHLLEIGNTIFRASSKAIWPGTANVTFSPIWIAKGAWNGEYMLDGKRVGGINSYLTEREPVDLPAQRLKANYELSYQGSIPLGEGFVLQHAEALSLRNGNERNDDVIYPYLVGKELNIHPTHEASKWIINFHDWPLNKESAPSGHSGPVAADYPECLQIIRDRVYPERTRRKENGEFQLRKPLPQKWWIYGDKRPELYAKLKRLKWALAIATQATKYVAFGKVSGKKVYSHAVAIIASDSYALAAVLSSSIHEAWARRYGGYNLLLLRYSPSDLFDTFALPSLDSALEIVGDSYFAFRAKIMSERKEGITATYNRFHDEGEKSEDIARLRKLHMEMDRAVAASYGWNDLDLGHGFHESKQGKRFTLSEPARRTILAKLLELNHQRYAEEVKTGLHEKKGKKATGDANRGRKSKTESATLEFL